MNDFEKLAAAKADIEEWQEQLHALLPSPHYEVNTSTSLRPKDLFELGVMHREQLAVAHAVTMEEAARAIGNGGLATKLLSDGLRAMAKLPSTLVAVERASIEKVRSELIKALGDGHNLKAFAGTVLRWGQPGVDVSDEARRVMDHAEQWHKRIVSALSLLDATLEVKS